MSDEPQIERKPLIARIDNSPSGWYENVCFELRILYAYLESVERLIVASIEIYEREKKIEVIYEDYEEGIEEVMTIHHGIYDLDYDLNKIFKEEFPNLQRRSALITLFSFFEDKLNELCGRFREELEVTVSFNDIKGKGMVRSILYLEKVAGLPISTEDKKKKPKTWPKIENIQSVRNTIVHNEGRMEKSNVANYVS
jgi:hypothetical protein